MDKKFSLFVFFLLLILSPRNIYAENAAEKALIFNVESSLDQQGRKEISADLIKTTRTAYWFLDNALTETEEIKNSLDSLSQEFEEKIYPTLTKVFGSEWNPGIDKDTRISILIHPMKQGRGGYFDSADEYPKIQIPDSNEREMIYLNSKYIASANAKSFLAHELMHLITFNQKDKINGISEDIWLNEARAEYVSTLLGYDSDYEGSNLYKRVRDFLNKPSDSLTEWRDFPEDYGVINLFTQYLADHYGVQILADSLKMRQTGIASISAVLSEKGFKEDFSMAFANWSIAVLVNDCQISEKYCYFNNNLKDFRITPLLNFLPSMGPSTLLVSNTTKDWSGNWHKFIGSNGVLNLEFKSTPGLVFKIPYILEKRGSKFFIDFLELNKDGQGELQLADFGSENISLTIIPILQSKTSNFSSLEPSRLFSWSVSTQKNEELNLPSLSPLTKLISQMTRKEILERISEIQVVILQLKALLATLTGSQISCQALTQNLHLGMTDNLQVSCLQGFLRSRGPDIYPEGIVNGNFYALTQKAVIRFQEKYASEILAPVGEAKGTGYVGPSTRAKINSLLTK